MTRMLDTSLIAAALFGAASLLATAGGAQAADMEKCFGIAKAGENGCANKAAGYSCAGHSTTDYSGGDWKLVPAGTCTEMGGKTEAFEGTGSPKES